MQGESLRGQRAQTQISMARWTLCFKSLPLFLRPLAKGTINLQAKPPFAGMATRMGQVSLYLPTWLFAQKFPPISAPTIGLIFMTNLLINGKKHTLDVEPDMPLLWVIRDELGLTGTKYGCGVAQCGACTVLVDGAPVRSCSYPNSAAQGKHITTIEGLSPNASHPVQVAWKDLDVPQCGYCQSGQILAAAALLKRKPKPTDQDIDEAMTNICRCGSYRRIRAGIHQAAKTGLGIDSVIHMVSSTAVLSQGVNTGEELQASCSGACQHDHGHDRTVQASLDASAASTPQTPPSRGFSSNCA